MFPEIPQYVGLIMIIGGTAMFVIFASERAYNLLPFAKLPLKEAAQIAYSKLRNTYMGALVDGVSEVGGKDVRLRHVGRMIVQDAQVLGYHGPSTILEAIPKEDKESFHLTDDVDGMAKNYLGDPIWTGLRVSRSDLNKFIKAHKKP